MHRDMGVRLMGENSRFDGFFFFFFYKKKETQPMGNRIPQEQRISGQDYGTLCEAPITPDELGTYLQTNPTHIGIIVRLQEDEYGFYVLKRVGQSYQSLYTSPNVPLFQGNPLTLFQEEDGLDLLTQYRILTQLRRCPPNYARSFLLSHYRRIVRTMLVSNPMLLEHLLNYLEGSSFILGGANPSTFEYLRDHLDEARENEDEQFLDQVVDDIRNITDSIRHRLEVID
jgi:hypothetical protein